MINSLMATWDESDSEKSKNSNKEQANIWLMADVDEKVESVCENNELKKSKTYLEQELKILKESLSQASTFGTTDEPSIIEKLREEVACLTKDFGNFLESYNNLSMLHKYH
ncbi:hypothetical protein HKD37_02G004485 [Glycine soja]